jgi:tryptophanyl-tRNA synthetase
MRVLSGLRPTGRLHLGHLVGVLNSMIELQKKADKCYFMIADWHALTTQYTDSTKIKDNSYLLLIHSLAAGIDPNKSIIFRQSDISAHLELSFIFSCFVPLGWLFRNPTYKEQKAELKGVDLSTYAFLGYPVLQAADILIYKAEVVPIGEDQKPHLELTREVARKFNRIWGEYFPYPEPYFAPHSKLPGLEFLRREDKEYVYGSEADIFT